MILAFLENITLFEVFIMLFVPLFIILLLLVLLIKAFRKR